MHMNVPHLVAYDNYALNKIKVCYNIFRIEAKRICKIGKLVVSFKTH